MNKLMRENLPDSYGFLELQNVILNIMQYIDTFCKEYKIEYCLMGGSVLGAKRHKGFIPWDDDLDIFMTPDNYEKFRRYFNKYGNKEKFYLQEWGKSNGLVSISKIRMNNTTYIEDDIKDWKIHQGIYIDIFILHVAPDNILKRTWQYVWAKYVIVKGLANRGYSRKKGLMGCIIKVIKFLPKRFLLNFALKQVYRYRNLSSNYFCNYLGKALMKNGTYSKHYFSSTKRVPFENLELSVPLNTEAFLSDRFGDYMKIPSPERIRYEQHASFWSTTENFPTYSVSGEYSDETFLI